MGNFFYLLLSVLLGATAQVSLKKGMQVVGEISITNLYSNIAKIVFNIYIIAGLVFYTLSLVIWLIVLSKMELSKAYPFVSIGYVITFFCGIIFLGEQITIYKLVGLVFVVTGIIIMSKGGI